MPQACDNCGGKRTMGAPVTYIDGEKRLAHSRTPDCEIVGYWCHECLIEHDLKMAKL